MKYNVFFTFHNPNIDKVTELPCQDNPLEYDSMTVILDQMSKNLPCFLQLEIIGVRIEKVNKE